MPQTLSREHHHSLENTAAKAHSEAETGAEKALKALAVGAKDAPAHATDVQKKQRVRLRAHGRALGDLLRPDDTQAVDHLVTEIAYEHRHSMLFARFLAESSLLMRPDSDSNTPTMNWLLYGDHAVAPLRRSQTGANMPSMEWSLSGGR